jgi:UDP-galactopyranose mutase
VQVRHDGDDRLFKDRFQGFPDARKGHNYEAQLRTMLKGTKIHGGCHCRLRQLMTLLGETPEAWRPEFIVVTVPLDEFSEEVYGPLEWRGLDFSAKWVPDDLVQERMVVNWPGKDVPWIRTHETKHASRQECHGTVLVTEFPGGEGRYYPVPGKGGALRELNSRYQDFARDTLEYRGPRVAFTGRLASFRYYDMDQVIRHALDTVRALMGGGDPAYVPQPA